MKRRPTLAIVLLAAIHSFTLVGVTCEPNIVNQIEGSPFLSGTAQLSTLTYNPTGKFLAVAAKAASDAVVVFSVASNGVLTEIVGSPFPTGNDPRDLAYSPDGLFLAAPNEIDNTVTIFSVASNGALTEIVGSPFPTGDDPRAVAYSPDGLFLTVANIVDNTVTIFSVASNGALTEIVDSPFSTGTNPRGVAYSPDGLFLAVSNEVDNTVTIFSVASNGALTEIVDSPFSTGGAPFGLEYSPNGRFLAVANNTDNTVTIFSVASNGALTEIGTFATTFSDTRQLAFHPTGNLLAVVGDAGPDIFKVFDDGTLKLIFSATIAGFGGDMDVAFSPGGNFMALSALGALEFRVPVFCVQINLAKCTQAIRDKYQPICPIQ